MKKGNTRHSTQSKLEWFPLQNYETVSIWGPWTSTSGGKRLAKTLFLLKFNFEGKKYSLAFALN